MKKCFCLLLMVTTFFRSVAQNYDDMSTVAMPSPNNNFLDGASRLGVSLYTGTPDINVPLYNLTSKDLTIPVSLAYVKGGGIKVQDVANYCGLGWQLVAGGCITRVVRSLPDEQTKGYIGTGKSGQALVNALNGNVNRQAGFDENISKGVLDGEPDLFSITTPFFSFQFVFDEYGNVVVSNNKGYKVTHNMYNNYSFQNSSWVVTDDKGNSFYFGTGWSSRESLTTKLFETDYTFTSTWYLDKIETFNRKEQIDFSYTYGNDYNYKHYLKTKTVFQTTSGTCSPPANSEIKDLTQTLTYKQPKYISQIKTSLGEVNFSYDFGRQDIANAGRLTSIAIKAYDPVLNTNTRTVKKYDFSYSYFGGPSGNNEALRLKLDYINMTALAASATPLRFKTFEYYMDANLPEMSSVEFDYSGYYNINSSGTSLSCDGANKTPNEIRTRANVLKSITDLSGVTDLLEYELNAYRDNVSSSNVTMAGLRIKKISQVLPSGETTFSEYIYTDNNGYSTGQVYKSTYNNFNRWVFLFSGISGNTVCGIDGRNYLSESIIDEYGLNGSLVGYSAVKVLNQNGGYEISKFYNFSDFPDAPNLVNSPNGNASRQLGSYTSLAYKRGLLTSKITYKSNGDKISEQSYSYAAQSAVTAKAWGMRTYPWNHVILGGTGYIKWTESIYNANVENYALVQTTSRVYDQNDQGLYQEGVTNYTYAANKYLIKTTNTTDSKGATKEATTYYPGDTGIPNVTADEQTAINALVQANCTSVPVHTSQTLNGTTVHNHNSFKQSQNVWRQPVVLLSSTTSYTNSNLADDQVKKKQYEYDVNTLNVLAVKSTGSPTQTNIYGYNNGLVTAEVTDAENKSWVIIEPYTNNSSMSIYSGDPYSQVHSIRVDYTGNVELSMVFRSTPTPESYAVVNYYLQSTNYFYSGNLCISGDNNCEFSTTISGVPPGEYTITIDPLENEYPLDVDFDINYSWPMYWSYPGSENQVYYEGFESYTYGRTFDPCAGKKCVGSGFSVPFMKPDDREYQVDYHYYSNGKWYSASKTYDNNMSLNEGSAVDEVRVYPKGALIKTYTYDALVGMTSMCDENNRITHYEYDAMGRLALIRDQDKNIIKRICYNYSGQSGDCSLFGNTTQTYSYTKSDCGPDAWGTSVPYTIAANTFYSAISVEDANEKTLSYMHANGRDYANTHGGCTPVYYNTEIRQTFYRTDCGPGYEPEPYEYVVEARRYGSTVPGEAQQQAQNEINQWGQYYANNVPCRQTHVAMQYDSYVYGYYVKFQDIYTNDEYEFELDGSGTLPLIPVGYYYVTFYDYEDNNNYYRFRLCGNTEYGDDAWYYGYYMGGDCNYFMIEDY